MQPLRQEEDPRTDAELVQAARQNDRTAFGTLYVRHRGSAHSFARTLLGSGQGADDLVAEAFVKVLQRLRDGGGPVSAFRSYLLTTIRTTLYKQLAADRMKVDKQVDLSDLSLPVWYGDPVLAQLETDLAIQALRSLPDRWRTVLSLLEIEELPVSAVAQRLELLPNAVYALAFRARDALRLAYLQMHVSRDLPDDCRVAAANLAPWLCGRLSLHLREHVRQHVAGCPRCAGAADELVEMISELRTVLLVVGDPPNLPRPRSGDPTALPDTGRRYG